MKRLIQLVSAAALALLLSSCALFGDTSDDIGHYLNGMSATMSTYDQFGHPIDVVKGKSFDVRRDDTFDSSDSEGNSNKDSSVIKISLGDEVIRHVASTMLLVEDGIIKISDAPTQVELENNDGGHPWINYLHQRASNLWKGKAQTLMIRSQNGTPIAVFAGDHVSVFAPNIPKTTRFRIDGKTLVVYRADYTIYPTVLLQ